VAIDSPQVLRITAFLPHFVVAVGTTTGVLCRRALARHRTRRTRRGLPPGQVVLRDDADLVGELGALRLRNQMFQTRPRRFKIVLRIVEQTEATRAAERRRVPAGWRGRPANAASPNRSRNRWSPRSATIVSPRPSDLLSAGLQVKREMRLEHLLQKRHQTLRPRLGVAHALERSSSSRTVLTRTSFQS